MGFNSHFALSSSACDRQKGCFFLSGIRKIVRQSERRESRKECKQAISLLILLPLSLPHQLPSARPLTRLVRSQKGGMCKCVCVCVARCSLRCWSICILTPIRRTNHGEAYPPSGVQRSSDRKERERGSETDAKSGK